MTLFSHNHKSLHRLFFVVFILFFPLSALAKVTYATVERFSVKQGLPETTTFSMDQDDNGFLWLGTPSGLVRYDGYDFELFSNAPQSTVPLVSLDAGLVFVDSKGRIWTGSWGSGLAVYNRQLNLLHQFKHDKNQPDSISNDKVQVVFEDIEGEIWVGTNGGGLSHFIESSNSFVNYLHDENDATTISHNRVWSIAQSSGPVLWVATSEGLNRFDKQSGQFERFYHQPSNEHSLTHSLVRTLAFGRSVNELWVGTEAGLGIFNTSTNRFDPVIDDSSNTGRSITRFLFDSDDNLWVGTQTGLLKYDLQSKRFVDLLSKDNKVLFPIDDIRDMHFDNTGLMWLATRYAGLIKVDLSGNKMQRFDRYVDNQGLPRKIDGVRSMFQDREGEIWISTWTKLLHMDGQGGGIKSFKSNDVAGTENIMTMTQSDDGSLWIGGIQGISQISADRTQLTRRNDLLAGMAIKSITSLWFDSPKTLWIGTAHNGLFKYENDKATFVDLEKADTRGKTISAIYQDDRQLVWASLSSGGVFQFDPTRELAMTYQFDETKKNSLSHERVAQIYQSKSGEIWLATKKYLNKLNDTSGGFEYFGIKHGINSNDIKSIIEDDSGDLWLGTGAGISQYHRNEERFTNYTAEDGFIQNNYYFEAVVKDQKGNLYFGGNQGIDKITPSRVNVNSDIPPVMITKVWVDNKAVKRYAFLSDNPLGLDSQVKNIRFSFAALDFKDPQKNLYSYRLKGFDDDWYDATNQRSASYTSLDPGSYTFQVKGSNNSGVWNPDASEFTIIITPPFYRTIWFYLVSGILVTLIYVTRTYRYRARKRALQQQVEEKTAELKVLGEIGKELNASLDMEAIFNLLYQHIRSLLDAHAFAIGILNKDDTQIEFKLIMEADQRLDPMSEPMHGNGQLSAWCINNGEEALVNGHSEIYNYLPSASEPKVGERMESIVYLPLMDKNSKVTGCMTIQSPRKNAYNPAQVDVIRMLASYTAIALNNAIAYAQVEQTNSEILAAQQQLVQSEKMASLGELTTGVAHEINNPTNFVHGCAQILTSELEEFQQFIGSLLTEDTEQNLLDSFEHRFSGLFKHLSTIMDGSQRIKAIVQDLRAFTRLDEAEVKSVHIGDCITSTLNLIKAKYAYEVKFETCFEVNPLIKCRPSRLNQVFMNILVNACDAIIDNPDKNGNGLITITVTQVETNIRIVIEDNGSGMDEKTKDKLFEPFYTTKPVGKGTGLGLSISFGIISDHQGNIEVHSERGKGSQFIINLPMAD